MYLDKIAKIKGKKDFKDAIFLYASKLYSQNLPVVFNLTHLAYHIGVEIDFLWHLVSRSDIGYERYFLIKKKFTSRRRKIYVPNINLLRVQKWINLEVLHKVKISDNSTAYSLGSNNIKNAQRHLHSKMLIKTDLVNFFESITEKQVYKIFKKLGYDKYLSFCFARICTVQCKNNFRHLPQGAPTSPMLANIACIDMDNKLEALARKYDLTYTRYSDDLTFSSEDISLDFENILNEIRDVIISHKFMLHKNKTRIVKPSHRKIVTGILLDSAGGKISVPRNYFLHVKAELYCMEKFGFINHCKKTNQSPVVVFNVIKGRIEYIKQVDISKWNKLMPIFNKINFRNIEKIAECVK